MIFLSLSLRMRNVSGKSCTENQNAHFMFNMVLFENRAVYEIMLQNRVQPDATDNIVRPMSIAYCIT
jgi:hypothetical protein